MSVLFKVGDDSACPSCKMTPSQGECVQCFTCKSMFHTICEKTNNDTKLGTNTLVKLFLSASTKGNFKFFCDICLTNLERNMVESQTDKINSLESKFVNMEDTLEEIKKLLTSKRETSVSTQKNTPASSIWFNKEKLETIKVPPPTSVLVLKKVDNEEKRVENQNAIETAIMDNNITVVESYQNKAGDLTIVCESADTRDELRRIVTLGNEEIVVNTPREIRHSITIVGLPKEYQEEEIMNMLVKQNGYIKKFAVSNNIKDHIKVHVVKPLKNNPSCFQIFCDVSAVLREGFHHYNEKVTLGLMSCKIYDRYNVKRCFNCQKFGHYIKDCPTKDEPICGKCSENHPTKDCESESRKCINCVRKNGDNIQHSASSIQCPSLMKEHTRLKMMSQSRLNSARHNAPPQR